MTGEKITIDKLAVMVQKGFDGVDKRFDGVDKRFDGVEGELGLIGKRLDVLEEELLYVKKKLDNIIYRHEFELLRDKVNDIEKRFAVAIKKQKN